MKLRAILFPGLALAGIAFMMLAVTGAAQPVPAAAPAVPPATSSFPRSVSGAGIVEASTENLRLGAPLSALVREVAVAAGDRVEAGAPLLVLDDRQAREELAVREAEAKTAQARLDSARTALEDQRGQLAFREGVQDPRSVSREELHRFRFAVRSAEAAEAAARAALAEAEARARAARTECERHVVRAPVAGRVLQMNARPGEFAQAQSALVLLGGVDPLHVRVDIDEHDAWRVKPGARAVASLRGNPEVSTPMTFVRIEPYVIPKRSLTGDAVERVDTRVLQALFRVDRTDLPLYVGQQMDVFVEEAP